jgi:hypothetical protein
MAFGQSDGQGKGDKIVKTAISGSKVCGSSQNPLFCALDLSDIDNKIEKLYS